MVIGEGMAIDLLFVNICLATGELDTMR